jgi:DNA polymerase I-like protein with 3'-5' exonuclease and polymerase domains
MMATIAETAVKAPRTSRNRKTGTDLSKAEKAAEKVLGRLARALEKAANASRKERAKADERRAKIRAAEGRILSLPAIVTREDVVPCEVADAATMLFSTVNAGGAITVDVETSGYPIGHRHYELRTIQLGTGAYAVVLDAWDSNHRDLASVVLRQAKMLHAHNATADLAPLAYAGLIDYREAWSRMVDTAVLAKLANPRLTGGDPGLKELSPRVLGHLSTVGETDRARKNLFRVAGWLTNSDTDTPPQRNGWYMVNKRCETMIRYAGADVLDTGALAVKLPWPEPNVLARERAFQAVMARVAFEGVRVDLDWTRYQISLQEPRVAEAARILRDNYGVENPGSPKQLKEAFQALGAQLPIGKTGTPTTDKDAMKKLAATADGPVKSMAEAVLEWRKAEKLLQMLRGYEDACINGDGFVRPTIYTLGADTGRTSCIRPNLQQVPKTANDGERGVRQCFRSKDDDWVLLACDFSQVEVRVGAALSQDQSFIRMINEGLNLHTEIADMVFGPGQWNAKQKTQIKAMNFCKMFGGGARTMAKQAGCSVELAEQVSKKFDQYAPAFAAWARNLVQGVEMGRTQFQTYSGRVIHLDPDAPHKAMNYPIQGTARELAVDASLAFAASEYGYGWQLIVHDELLVTVRREHAEAATAKLLEVMTRDFMGVPITAEADPPSTHWPVPEA